MGENSLKISTLKINKLAFAYDCGLPIFENVTLNFPMGKIVWLGGESGCGKSALLKLLIGIESPTAGEILMDNVDIAQLSFEELLPYRMRIGYSFDLGGLLNNKTLKDNLSLPLLYHNNLDTDVVDERVENYIEKFGLSKFKNFRPAEVSGGVRKAACLARSFIMEPTMILMDDPSTGLGPPLRKVLRDHIREKMESGQLEHVFIASDDRRFMDGFSNTKVILEKNKFEVSAELGA